MNEGAKRGWTNLMLDYAGEGQELDLPDKILIREQVEKFVDDYVKFHGKTPLFHPAHIRACSDYIIPFGYSLSVVERYKKDAEEEISYAEKKSLGLKV